VTEATQEIVSKGNKWVISCLNVHIDDRDQQLGTEIDFQATEDGIHYFAYHIQI